MTYEKLLDFGLEHYKPHYVDTDNETVKENNVCPICSSTNCHYEGYKKDSSYRAFSICENNHIFEF